MKIITKCSTAVPMCPAIIEMTESGTYVIVGTIYLGLDVAELVGEGEEAVEIPAALVEEFLRRNGNSGERG